MGKTETHTSEGIGCFTVVGIVLVTLKLVGVAPVDSWPWLWVLAPFWAPIALLIIVLVIISIIAGRS